MPEEFEGQSINPFEEDDFDVSSRPASKGGVNRPAEGARQASPGEVLSQDFEGAENAGDFLGLDVELTGASGPGDGLDLASPLGGRRGVDYDAQFGLDGPTQLMHADDEHDGGDPVPSTPRSTASASEHAPSFDGAAPPEPDFDEFEDALEERYEEEFADRKSSRGRGKLVVGILFAAVIGAAGMYAPKFLDGYGLSGKKQVVTRAPKSTPDTTTAGAASTGTDPVAVASGTDAAAGTEDPASSTTETPGDAVVADGGSTTTVPADAGASAGQDAAGGDDSTIAQASDFTTDVMGALSETLDPDGVASVDTNPDDTAIDEETRAITAEVAASLGMADEFADIGEFDWASDDMLDIVWRGTEIPMEAIEASARTLMPRVGDVRVHLTSGRTVEGRLYAVGQGRVWVDIPPGRLGLDGGQVERFQHLVAASDDTTIASSGEAGMGIRVRVRAPGGMIYGKIIKRDGDVVSMICDDGSKITMRGVEPEPLGSRRAIVVQK